MNDSQITIQKLIYWMTHIPHFGAVRIRKICQACESAEHLYNIEGKDLAKQNLIRAEDAAAWDYAKRVRHKYLGDYDRLGTRGIQFITPLDGAYPKRLKHLHDYPMGLFVKGRLPADDRPTAAIIGARACTSFGRQEAETTAAVLARAGIQIISGLAAGIDGAGHRGALKEGKDTYGILGSGVNICYPAEHYPMSEQMIENGGIISEYPLGATPKRQHFPMRNRIISGLSDVIVVIEARERSGSLITVELGLEQGKEIFAIPGRISDSLSSGCNRLIQQGANMVISPYDIVEYFGISYEKMLRVHEINEKTLAKSEKMVYSCLDLQPKHIDVIIEESGLAVGACMQVLLELEIKGYLTRTAGLYYIKKVY